MTDAVNLGQAPLRRVLAKTPNIYIPCHDPWDKNNPAVSGYAEGDAAGNADVLDVMMGYYDLADGSGEQQVQLTLNNNNSDVQWGGANPDGYYQGSTANTTDFATLAMDAGNADLFTNVLNLKDNAALVCFRGRADAAAPLGAVTRFASLMDQLGSPAKAMWEIKYATDLRPDFFQVNSSVSNAAIQTAFTNGQELLVMFYINNTGTGSAQCHSYPLASKVKHGTGLAKTEYMPLANVVPTIGNAIFGIACLVNNNTPAYSAQLRDASLQDFRVINFGATPPADVNSIMEDMAVNNLKGTTLDL